MEPTDEQVRILRAARDGRLHSIGHWVIDGESRPERQALDGAKAAGWLTDAIVRGGWAYELSPDGRGALEAAESADPSAPPPPGPSAA
ncbi:hypothetical protein Q5424_14975 [Conexibacter sp. JD483]|uniref:hypothetical protein n=1 Tax=unclassified Conexibacter TaxID=2627773 RepID=UPI002716C3EB|nr:MULTISPECIES: hypothetical protein [unclassified Conexibacter]MDO8187984.1 hypothetical protein [Conexibacter sp. CPCC 205706]MDO8200867.1 hypothetical protein [Conexibacter sp. CPCC 205762]MDR9370400.1 hypothetical protein [Conexibacter sp. JD483]